MLRILSVILCCFALGACASAQMSQHVEMGKLEFKAGNYKKSFQELLPVASEGDATAQYAVGYMYYYGFGVPQDADSGMFWMQKSADQHNANAIAALQMLQTKK